MVCVDPHAERNLVCSYFVSMMTPGRVTQPQQSNLEGLPHAQRGYKSPSRESREKFTSRV